MSTARLEKQDTRRKFWQKHISFWKKSGLSQRSYCLEHNLALSTFTYWHRKFKKLSQGEQPQFYPLTLPVTLNTGRDNIGSGLRLLLQNEKYCIDIEKEFSSAALKKIVQVLEGY